ncbi:unnamed protein product [Gadus morhua 'NCC']
MADGFPLLQCHPPVMPADRRHMAWANMIQRARVSSIVVVGLGARSRWAPTPPPRTAAIINNKIITALTRSEVNSPCLLFSELVDNRGEIHFLALSFSMDSVANTLNRYCAMELLREVFINLSLENDRSAVATVTGMVTYRKNAVQTFRIKHIQVFLLFTFFGTTFRLLNIAVVWLSF